MTLVTSAWAAPTIGNCGANDAPNPFGGQSCNSMCTASATVFGYIVQCDMATAGCTGGGSDLTKAVHDYAGTGAHDFSAWGECTVSGVTTDWCCVIDDNGAGTAEITHFQLIGGSGADILAFYEGTKNMEPHTSDDLIGSIYAGDGGDNIWGSDYAGSGYNDHLYGEKDDDVIMGLAGGDRLLGGQGADQLFGQEGNDRLHGGDGEDELHGNEGNDTICETSEDSAGVCTQNYATGNAGNNRLWLDYSATCDPAGDFSTSTNAGPGMNDQCGSSATGAWGSTPWTDCDTDITTRPTTCP